MAATFVTTSGTATVEMTPELGKVLDLLTKKGLAPNFGHPWRGSITLSFGITVGGTEGTFGGMDIGVTSGKLLRSTVKYGNTGPKVQCDTWAKLIAELNKI